MSRTVRRACSRKIAGAEPMRAVPGLNRKTLTSISRPGRLPLVDADEALAYAERVLDALAPAHVSR
jgi:hypothetical protein